MKSCLDTMLIEQQSWFSVQKKKRFLNEPLWERSYLNYFSEWRKAELMRVRSKPVEETKMLRGNESPAGIPAIHRLTIKTLIKHDPSEVQSL